MSVQSDIAGTVGEWIGLLSAVVRNNPGGDIYDILTRPDVAGELQRSLTRAQGIAAGGLDGAWHSLDPVPYLASLHGDVERAYLEEASALREAVIGAFQSVPPAEFVQGVTQPGRNPAMEAAADRARAVESAAARQAWHLGMRNELTVTVARTRHVTEDVLAGAEPGMLKKWKVRPGACDWCRQLAAQPAIPVDQEFGYGESVGRRQPPRVYLDLLGPPRHPRCRCRIILVRGGSTEAAGREPAGTAPLFIPAQSVRDMPGDRYQALHEFHSAALHELGRTLRGRRPSGSG